MERTCIRTGCRGAMRETSRATDRDGDVTISLRCPDCGRKSSEVHPPKRKGVQSHWDERDRPGWGDAIVVDGRLVPQGDVDLARSVVAFFAGLKAWAERPKVDIEALLAEGRPVAGGGLYFDRALSPDEVAALREYLAPELDIVAGGGDLANGESRTGLTRPEQSSGHRSPSRRFTSAEEAERWHRGRGVPGMFTTAADFVKRRELPPASRYDRKGACFFDLSWSVVDVKPIEPAYPAVRVTLKTNTIEAEKVAAILRAAQGRTDVVGYLCAEKRRGHVVAVDQLPVRSMPGSEIWLNMVLHPCAGDAS